MFFVGLMVGLGFGDFALSDELSDVNTDTSSTERTFNLDSPTSVYSATSTTGDTAPGIMSVVGAVSIDGSEYATIIYATNCFGFTVNEGITLNLTNVKFENAKTSLTYGSFVKNAGILNIDNVIFDNGRVVPASGDAYGGAIYNTGTINLLKASFNNNHASGSNAYGGAIYNTGTIKTISGDFTNNSASGSANAYGGAIYTSSNITLLADESDFKISGNTAKVGLTTTNQAIYVFDSAVKEHEEAKNNTTLTINPSTSTQTILPTGDYTGYDEITVNPVTFAVDPLTCNPIDET